MLNSARSSDGFVSDVTPWWWLQEWGRASPDIDRALLYVSRKLAHSDVESIAVSSRGIHVTFAVADDDDLEQIKNRARDVREELDEFVAPVDDPLRA